MNLWVLFLCRFLVHSKVKKKRVFLSALLASAGEVVMVCIPIGDSRMKILFGFGGITGIIIYWLFSPKTREYFYRLLMYAYLSASILGGGLLLLDFVFPREFTSYGGSCIGILFLAGLAVKIYKKVGNPGDFGEVELTISEKKQCTITALIDSGNGLVEPVSGKPVSLVEKSIMEGFQTELLSENFRIVPFSSIGKEKGVLEAYFIERMEIRRGGESIVVEKPIIAIAQNGISSKKMYQMILHPALLKN